MTDPQPTPALLAYQTPVPSRRPTSVLVLAIIGTLIAGVMLLRFGAFVFFTLSNLFNSGVFGGMPLWWMGQIFLSGAFAVALLIICIAAIRMRPWARFAWSRWAKWYILWLVIGEVIIVIEMMSYLADLPGPWWENAMPLIVAGVRLLLSCVYPAFVLLFVNRPNVRAAFATDSIAAAAEPAPIAAVPVERAAP